MVKRLNIAERMYRITGRGIYRDTILLGKKPPIEFGAIDGKVIVRTGRRIPVGRYGPRRGQGRL